MVEVAGRMSVVFKNQTAPKIIKNSGRKSEERDMALLRKISDDPDYWVAEVV